MVGNDSNCGFGDNRILANETFDKIFPLEEVGVKTISHLKLLSQYTRSMFSQKATHFYLPHGSFSILELIYNKAPLFSRY